MRKCVISRLINAIEHRDIFDPDCRGQSAWGISEGLFHQWGTGTDADGNVHTVALVELEDGTIVEVLPCHIVFPENIVFPEKEK